LLAGSLHGDFLQFGGLLAADAVSRFECYEVADLAQVAYAKSSPWWIVCEH
jgi:hypothetical protein